MAPRRRKLIVGLTGKAGSGKSEAAQHLADRHGFSQVKFAAPLKAMLRAYYRELGLRYDEISRRIEGDLKEVPCAYLGGQTPRYAMQTLGTEWGRQCMGQSFWVDAWRTRVDRLETDVVTDDVRFDNEAAMLKSLDGHIIQLEPAEQRREHSEHASEKGINPALVDASITNGGTLEQLRLNTTLTIAQF